MTTNIVTNSSSNEITYTNENKPLAILNPENICFKCLQEKQVFEICIPSIGNGSYFDNFSSRIYLCENCLKQYTNLEWWKLEIIENKDDWYDIHYKYEKEILEFINSLLIQGKELFYTRLAHGDKSYMIGQDWIDFKLGILSHEKCKEYGYYSPDEKVAYYEMFPKCQHPVNKIYNDDSKSCWCPFGSHGRYNQECSGMCNDCYECQYYQERITPIIDINEDKWKDYKIYYIAKINAEKYKLYFEKENKNNVELESKNITEKENN